jgi:hypothetical protein
MIKLIKLWILASVACVSAGWILSALHQLNLAGYAVYFVVLAAGLAFACARRRREGRASCAGAKWARWNMRRFRRPLPLLFLLTAALTVVGGMVHAPNNYDALTYRFPRVLHWWGASGWHWITTSNDRMNLSGTNFEWLMMPLFLVTHSDRLFFLINIAAYLLLPGLVFVVFLAAGVARRVAWFWMWLMPAALCYAMQAGSISNDTIAVTYFLSALYFAFQARRHGSAGDLWLAFLAAGLLTGVKASNLPLLLPVAWVMLPSWRLVEKRFAGSVAVIMVSLLVSYLPTAALNLHYTGDWAGDPTNSERIKVEKPLAGILGNGLQLGLQSLEPPFLPLARSAENWVWERFPEGIRAVLMKDFPRFVVGFRELPQEESSGVGIGITLIAIVSVVAALRFRRRNQPRSPDLARRLGLTIGVLTWVALLVYMSKLGSEATSRLIAAYYPLLLLPLLSNPAQSILIRQGWYKALAICAGSIALLAVILTPSRPLWPAGCFFDWAVDRFPESALMAHAQMVYTVYRSRNDIFAGLRRSIPESVAVIGLIEGGDDAESSLWRPFGARRVVHVLEASRIGESKLQWLVVKNNVIDLDEPKVFEKWLRHTGGILIDQQSVTEKAGRGPEQWSVIHFPGAAN